jgi:hypothetical protein
VGSTVIESSMCGQSRGLGDLWIYVRLSLVIAATRHPFCRPFFQRRPGPPDTKAKLVKPRASNPGRDSPKEMENKEEGGGGEI